MFLARIWRQKYAFLVPSSSSPPSSGYPGEEKYQKVNRWSETQQIKYLLRVAATGTESEYKWFCSNLPGKWREAC